ncbi:hypothetical protein HOD19_01710 [bacterium]|nr:hypothetical protein [bacterium]MBT4649421.1 hypothetical protein [bacterium]
MYISKNKIYWRFIAWFLIVALLTTAIILAIFWSVIAKDLNLFYLAIDKIVLSLVFTIASVIILAIIAARKINLPNHGVVQEQIVEIRKIIKTFKKSLNNLSNINKDNKENIEVLSLNIKSCQTGFKVNNQTGTEIKSSIKQIANKINKTAQSTVMIDNLATNSENKSQSALDSLVVIKQLSTDNQKLYVALDAYTDKIQFIAQRVASMADLAHYLSLNTAVEAHKTADSEEFSSLVGQIRQLNSVGQQVAVNIQGLTEDMQRQLKQSQQRAVNKQGSADKNITTIGQTINFLTKISKQTKDICQDIKIIDQETKDVRQSIEKIDSTTTILDKDSKNLSKNINQVSNSVKKQVYAIGTLNRSFNNLQRVIDSLSSLLGSK